MEMDHKQLVKIVKQHLIDQYDYNSALVLENYQIKLNDGTIVYPDLVLITLFRVKPYGVIFVTNDEIPKDEIKCILLNSDIERGICQKIDKTGLGEFWGIIKEKSIFRKDKIVPLMNYRTNYQVNMPWF